MKSKEEMQAYHDMMKAAIGHIDVSIDKELGAGNAAAKEAPSAADKVAELKKFESENPIVKVHPLPCPVCPAPSLPSLPPPSRKPFTLPAPRPSRVHGAGEEG